ncbi:hypothetical protein PGB90_007922 [Kerria lacca]
MVPVLVAGVFFHHLEDFTGGDGPRSLETNVLRDAASSTSECQSLAEENKKLQRLSLQSANSNVLQTQVDSLQWQLRQMESSRQMYRAVMEQVSKFLERVHKNLDIISSKMSTSPKTKTSRFPRSRSVHTMAGTCANSNSGSRCSSPSPTHYSTISISNSSQITNCNVIEQIHELDTSPQDSLNNTFREYTWKPVRPASEHVTLEKLSQESFRFYRTVQSLLNTREPDLIHRLTPAVSEVMIPDSNEKIDNNSVLPNYCAFMSWLREGKNLPVREVGSCVSLFQNNSVSNRKSLDTSSTCSIQYAITHELENTTTKIDNSCSKPISIEDESGFSSMSSFHDANILPEMKSYPKLGLPIVKCDEPKHKRWNSTPVDKMYDSSNMSVSFCNNNEILQVLWV